MHCLNENIDANPHFAFFFQVFNFSFCHSFIIHMDIFFCQRFLSIYLFRIRILKFGTQLDSNEVYKKQPHIAYQSLYLFIYFLSNENFN